MTDTKTIPSPLEGGNCEVIYKFKIKQTDKPNSYIVFIEDFGDQKYMSGAYIYDNNKNEIHKLKR